MKPKFLLLGTLILFSIFIHYSLKNEIVMTARVNLKIETELEAEKANNRDLLSQYHDLQAYSRIVQLASERLNMVFSNNDPDKVIIVYQNVRNNKTSFTFLDHITPSAEAITRR